MLGSCADEGGGGTCTCMTAWLVGPVVPRAVLITTVTWAECRGYKPNTMPTFLACTSLLHQVASYRRMSRYNSVDLAMTLWACGKLRLKLEPLWVQQSLREASRLMPLMGPNHLANTVWALARLKKRPDEAWVDGFCEAAYKQLPRFSPHELSCMLWALATLNGHVDKVRLVRAGGGPWARFAGDGAVGSSFFGGQGPMKAIMDSLVVIN